MLITSGWRSKRFDVGALAVAFVIVSLSQESMAQRPSADPQGSYGESHGMVPFGPPIANTRSGPPVRAWQCTKCKAEVGRSATMPELTECPHCGVHFDPKYKVPNVVNNTRGGMSVPPIGLLGFACIGFLVGAVIVAVLIKWALG
jgi:hypothetical protein